MGVKNRARSVAHLSQRVLLPSLCFVLSVCLLLGVVAPDPCIGEAHDHSNTDGTTCALCIALVDSLPVDGAIALGEPILRQVGILQRGGQHAAHRLQRTEHLIRAPPLS